MKSSRSSVTTHIGPSQCGNQDRTIFAGWENQGAVDGNDIIDK
jgi:hypothetical protein